MADEAKTTKKSKIKVCVKTQKNMKRLTWYYRDGHYFQNKRIYREWKKEKAAAAAESKTSETAPVS
ncbi:MAG: hypothetical protein JW774_11570 [Candidatus Aureabacteria bacterium]|nr:hypothetical protein [Candidatus Auribacterota bacterium]